MNNVHIGNYGVKDTDVESDSIKIKGLIARNLDLVVTGSSDYHGEGKVDHDLGCNTTDPDELSRLVEAVFLAQICEEDGRFSIVDCRVSIVGCAKRPGSGEHQRIDRGAAEGEGTGVFDVDVDQAADAGGRVQVDELAGAGAAEWLLIAHAFDEDLLGGAEVGVVDLLGDDGFDGFDAGPLGPGRFEPGAVSREEGRPGPC